MGAKGHLCILEGTMGYYYLPRLQRNLEEEDSAELSWKKASEMPGDQSAG
jgi:hypothetical protein